MTRIVVALALVALQALSILPAADAQGDSPAGATLLEDPSGDIAAEANGAPTPVPAGRFAAADVASLAIEESRLDFTFRLAVADLQPDAEVALLESSRYAIDFMHGDRHFRIYASRSTLTEASYWAYLSLVQAEQDFPEFITELPITADIGTATMAIGVARDLLIDSEGSAPFPGRSLTGFHVRSVGFIDMTGAFIGLGPAGEVPFPATVTIVDAMPDAGNGTLDWAVRLGLAQSGAVRLATRVPVRSSNGEATTFLFEVNATNAGPTQRFGLSASDVPATWHVELPGKDIEIPEKSTVRIPVLVSTPFAHEHGRLQGFVLQATGADSAGDVGRVQLGVRYTSPPQPAGHHATLYLHTAPSVGDEALNTAFGTAFGFEWRDLYFNTQAPADDPNDQQVPVGGSMSRIQPGPPPLVTYTWRVPLSPGLEMGLDFDLSRAGQIDLAVDSLLPLPGAVLTGRLVYTVPDGRTDCQDGCTIDDLYYGYGKHETVATVGPSAAVEVPPAAAGATIQAPIMALPAGDYLPFAPGAGLGLELNLTFVRVDPLLGPHDYPKVSGGEFVLPLLEYHDPVDQAFSSLAGLMIVVNGEQQRMVNPGKTALYDLSLMNHGTEEATFDLELSGASSDWASVVGDRRVTVPAGETRQLAVAVTAPGSAKDGEVADVVFAAVDASDPSARTLARLVTTVDTDAEHPDDSARVPGLQERLSSKDTPGLAPLAALAVPALAAVALRRRKA